MIKTTPEEAKAIAKKFLLNQACLLHSTPEWFDRNLAALIDEVRGVDAKPIGYVHLIPDQHSPKYDVRFWQPVAMGTKLYDCPAPSQPALTDAQMDLVRRYGVTKTNAEIRAMLGETVKPAQEEIMDVEILLPKPDCLNIWGGCYSKKLVLEILRSSKGDK